MKPIISTETQQNALAAAKATQKPGQNKQQTKLIAQGIEKGITEYKKQQKAKSRERDKQRKQQLKSKVEPSGCHENDIDECDAIKQWTPLAGLLLTLLVLSWVGFIAYLTLM